MQTAIHKGALSERHHILISATRTPPDSGPVADLHTLSDAVDMETTHHQRTIGKITWRAAIVLGIGDNDTVGVVTETDHADEQTARAWIEQQLPHAVFPEWVTRRRHGTAGAFMFGQIERGYYTGPNEDDWQPALDDRLWDADLIHGVVHWQERRI